MRSRRLVVLPIGRTLSGGRGSGSLVGKPPPGIGNLSSHWPSGQHGGRGARIVSGDNHNAQPPAKALQWLMANLKAKEPAATVSQFGKVASRGLSNVEAPNKSGQGIARLLSCGTVQVAPPGVARNQASSLDEADYERLEQPADEAIESENAVDAPLSEKSKGDGELESYAPAATRAAASDAAECRAASDGLHAFLKTLKGPHVRPVTLAAFAAIAAEAAQHPVSIISAPTGVGKSSLIPLLLAEAANHRSANWTKVGTPTADSARRRPHQVWVSQPTRIGCVLLARHVASLCRTTVGHRVGYAVGGRETAWNSTQTEIVYATPGYILARFATKKAPRSDGKRGESAQEGEEKGEPIAFLVLDEAHVRDMHSDLLLAWARLQRGGPASPFSAMRVVIMGATLDVPLLQKALSIPDCAVFRLDTRPFPAAAPVEVARRPPAVPSTPTAVRQPLDQPTVSLVGDDDKHRLFPTVVQFLDNLGPESGLSRCARNALTTAFANPNALLSGGLTESCFRALAEAATQFVLAAAATWARVVRASPATRGGKKEVPVGLLRSTLLVFLPGWNEIVETLHAIATFPGVKRDAGSDAALRSKPGELTAETDAVFTFAVATPEGLVPFDVLLLHGSEVGDAAEALRASSGAFRVVLATNVVENSVTIHNVATVLDTALERYRVTDRACGTTEFVTRYCTQGSLIQRRGRAGRVQAGVAIHLIPRELAEAQPFVHRGQTHREGVERTLLAAALLLPACSFADLSSLLPVPIPPVKQREARASLESQGLLHRLAPVGTAASADDDVAAHVVAAASAFPQQQPGGGDGPPRLTSLGQLVASLPFHIPVAAFVVHALHFGCVVDALLVAAALEAPAVIHQPRTVASSAAWWEAMETLSEGEPSDAWVLRNVMAAWIDHCSGIDATAASHTSPPSDGSAPPSSPVPVFRWSAVARPHALRGACAAIAGAVSRLENLLSVSLEMQEEWRDELWLLSQLGLAASIAASFDPALAKRRLGPKAPTTSITGLLCPRRSRLLAAFCAAFGQLALMQPVVVQDTFLQRMTSMCAAAPSRAAVVVPFRRVDDDGESPLLPLDTRAIEAFLAQPLRDASPAYFGALEATVTSAAASGHEAFGAVVLRLPASPVAPPTQLQHRPLTASLEMAAASATSSVPPGGPAACPAHQLPFASPSLPHSAALQEAVRLLLRSSSLKAKKQLAVRVPLLPSEDVAAENGTLSTTQSDPAVDREAAETAAGQPTTGASSPLPRAAGPAVRWRLRAAAAAVEEQHGTVEVLGNGDEVLFSASVALLLAHGLGSMIPAPQPAEEASLIAEEALGDLVVDAPVEGALPSSPGDDLAPLGRMIRGNPNAYFYKRFVAMEPLPLEQLPPRNTATPATNTAVVIFSGNATTDGALAWVLPRPPLSVSTDVDALPSASGTDPPKMCACCDMWVPAVNWASHVRSLRHVMRLCSTPLLSVPVAEGAKLLPLGAAEAGTEVLAPQVELSVQLPTRTFLRALRFAGFPVADASASSLLATPLAMAGAFAVAARLVSLDPGQRLAVEKSSRFPAISCPPETATTSTDDAVASTVGEFPSTNVADRRWAQKAVGAHGVWAVTVSASAVAIGGLAASAVAAARDIFLLTSLAEPSHVRGVLLPGQLCLPVAMTSPDADALAAVARWAGSLPDRASRKDTEIRRHLLRLENYHSGATVDSADDHWLWIPLSARSSDGGAAAGGPPAALEGNAARVESAILIELYQVGLLCRASSGVELRPGGGGVQISLTQLLQRICRRLVDPKTSAAASIAADDDDGAAAAPSSDRAEKYVTSRTLLREYMTAAGFRSFVDVLVAAGCTFRRIDVVVPPVLPTRLVPFPSVARKPMNPGIVEL